MVTCRKCITNAIVLTLLFAFVCVYVRVRLVSINIDVDHRTTCDIIRLGCASSNRLTIYAENARRGENVALVIMHTIGVHFALCESSEIFIFAEHAVASHRDSAGNRAM
jgi:hypothetical protein